MPHAGTSLRALLEQVWLARARNDALWCEARAPLQPDLLPCAGAGASPLRSSSLVEDCHAQERVPRAYPSRNPDLTLACAASRAHDECAHFCSWTGWATQRVSIPTELPFTRYRLTPLALILITGSSVVKCAAVRPLGQGPGRGNSSCWWLERWQSPL